MHNELLLILNIIIAYGGVLVFYRLFHTEGLIAFSVIATLLANIEVMILIDAFALEQTLGNILFATTFLISDILSETEGKEKANKAVNLGIAASVIFIILSQIWISFVPSPNDLAFPHFQEIFSRTPRIVIAGFAVYAFVQKLDIFLYHKWWNFTKKRFHDEKRFLWLRNNGSTLISQLVNSILFNIIAFWGVYPLSSLISITGATYLIYIVTSLLDTPVIYLARKLHS